MAHTIASLSLSHALRDTPTEVRVPGQRGGHHFDVVFRGTSLEAARPTILNHLRQVMAARITHAHLFAQTAPRAACVFQEATISGLWREEVFADGRPSRLLLVADGWAIAGLDGTPISGGTLMACDAVSAS